MRIRETEKSDSMHCLTDNESYRLLLIDGWIAGKEEREEQGDSLDQRPSRGQGSWVREG